MGELVINYINLIWIIKLKYELYEGGNSVSFQKELTCQHTRAWCYYKRITLIHLLIVHLPINVNNDENTKAIWWILEGLISLRAFIDFIPSSNDDTVIAYKHILLHKGFEGSPDMRNCNSTTLHPYTCWDILIHLPVYDLFFLATLILVFIQQKP